MKNTAFFVQRGLLFSLFACLPFMAAAQDKIQPVRVSTWVPAQHA